MQGVDYKSLNRSADLSTLQKKALKKVFLAGEAAAQNSEPKLCNTTIIHRAVGGWFSGDEQGDIQALFKAVRTAIDTSDTKYDLTHVVGSFRMGGTRRRLLRTMAEAVVAQIPVRD